MNTDTRLKIDTLAAEQAIINHANETDMPAEEALALNAWSLRTYQERLWFKIDYRRHARNIEDGNRFYF